jgi:hypothetical protein
MIFVGIILLSIMLWLHLAREMPLRYFAWFSLLTGTYAAAELVVVRLFAGKVKQNRYLRILLELVLGIIFVAVFTLFAIHVYPR